MGGAAEIPVRWNPHLAMEHYRLHVMERWPDGPRKNAGLAATRSTVEGLFRTICHDASFVCATCACEGVDAVCTGLHTVENQAPVEITTFPDHIKP